MLDYASDQTEDTNKRERHYTICTAVVGTLYAWSGAFMLFLAPQIPNQDDFGKRLFRGIGLFELILALTFFAIVALRCWKPRQHSLILLILHAFVLFAFPFGTVLSLYYFIRLRPYDTQP